MVKPSTTPAVADPMRAYRAKRDAARRTVAASYHILGFISSGTYGRVYKAQSTAPADGAVYAIKKFKPDKEGDVITYTGISQSAVREIMLNRELVHENVVRLKEVILEEKSIYMVFEYAEHDFLQVIHHHSQVHRGPLPPGVLKSLIYQLLNGLLYLHTLHILHRDLKPANILITRHGVVKIGDLGLARLSSAPLQPLFAGDKVVVTIWYRAPELLLGAKHYNRAVDCWAVGCVMAELASLRPVFKGEEAKLDAKKNVPFQRDQLLRIFEVLGTPSEEAWPGVVDMPEYGAMKRLDRPVHLLFMWRLRLTIMCRFEDRLLAWCRPQGMPPRIAAQEGYALLRGLFAYDPDARLDARGALAHRWFAEEPLPTANAFESATPKQIPPHRRITTDDAPSMMPPTAQPQTQAFTSLSGGAGGAGSGGGPTRKKARIG
ncbi:hypothetical protein HWV62_9165 [Athelia sp. TMB]|nr:hypothetical protein HWV62_9165 [Athelia sp. TMB]